MNGIAHARRWLQVFLTSLVIGALGATAVLLGTSGSPQGYTPAPTADSSHTRVQQLMQAHDCWTGTPPADMQRQVPGHVVVTKRSGRTVYGGDRLVGKALDQQFAHKRSGLIIHGFCR